MKDDLTVAEFLRRHFAGPEYDRLRRSITRMVEGYDAADPERASILALRDEWMGGARSTQVRVAGGYGGMIDFLVTGCKSQGAAIHLGTIVKAIDTAATGANVRCANGDTHPCDAVILTVPQPLLKQIELPAIERERAAAAAQIGFGNIIKILLRFRSRWWLEQQNDLADLSFLLSEERIPVWWTQHPIDLPVLTGWFGGPKPPRWPSLTSANLSKPGLLRWPASSVLTRSNWRSMWWRRERSIGRGSIRARRLLLLNAANPRGAVGAVDAERRADILLR